MREAILKRTVEVDICLTPAELAAEFCELDSEEQAMFFSELAVLAKEWGHHFDFQLRGITDERALTDAGRRIMRSIGDYSKK